MSKYTGGCHCGAVKYEVETDLEKVIECNCSHCHKKGFLLTFVDKDKFAIISGADNLSEYQFNKKAIRHLFCKTCGVQSFAEGISFPQIAINVRCLDDVDTKSLSIEQYNGKDI
ncbi:MAG: glutathione-dependent formaldehyde-activating protein [Candidatus Adlerbacteria bacterium]|nr:glutathione-dependent formaldehyde-activating protein [Candidatus Adlerbacteria bacterium]